MAPPADQSEIPLDGGHTNDAVVRVGATVRRATSAQTATIHRLLTHARGQGVAWVPRVHGTDERGREVLDFIDGEVPHGEPSWLWADQVLVQVAQALREWHDATATFARSSQDVWWQPPREPADVICHGDFAPYNHVFRDGHLVGAIDFDTCLPAPRMWDLAWTAYRYVPLRPSATAHVDDGPGADRTLLPASALRERLDLLLEAYGPLDHPGEVGPARPFNAGELLAWVPERLHAIAHWGEGQDDPDHQRWAAMYRAHAHWVSTGERLASPGSLGA
jgi:aminoglycoside phosphotransferase (APT) family kinase protein